MANRNNLNYHRTCSNKMTSLKLSQDLNKEVFITQGNIKRSPSKASNNGLLKRVTADDKIKKAKKSQKEVISKKKDDKIVEYIKVINNFSTELKKKAFTVEANIQLSLINKLDKMKSSVALFIAQMSLFFLQSFNNSMSLKEIEKTRSSSTITERNLNCIVFNNVVTTFKVYDNIKKFNCSNVIIRGMANTKLTISSNNVPNSLKMMKIELVGNEISGEIPSNLSGLWLSGTHKNSIYSGHLGMGNSKNLRILIIENCGLLKYVLNGLRRNKEIKTFICFQSNCSCWSKIYLFNKELKKMASILPNDVYEDEDKLRNAVQNKNCLKEDRIGVMLFKDFKELTYIGKKILPERIRKISHYLKENSIKIN
uniref:Leucine-rich repeat protein n=1 Tax=Parastrongyloides trichosuri TaxID=131310 RepID=A0A0N4Z9M8_PARTI